jgi:ribose/xylose/arabinose/galactoside ABC-type transport system permease subunit
MFIAYLKLHQRNIGPLLDASGWAVNAFARVNVPFGSALTSVATLPPGAVRTLKDPFAEKRTPWKTYLLLAILLALLVAWMFGKFDGLLPDRGRPDGLFRGFSSAAPTP